MKKVEVASLPSSYLPLPLRKGVLLHYWYKIEGLLVVMFVVVE